jgi:hypothetical protein
MSTMVYRATDLIDRVEARVYEHSDRYTVSLLDLDSGETAGTVIYRFANWGEKSMALTRAAEKANYWTAPVPVSRPNCHCRRCRPAAITKEQLT